MQSTGRAATLSARPPVGGARWCGAARQGHAHGPAADDPTARPPGATPHTSPSPRAPHRPRVAHGQHL